MPKPKESKKSKFVLNGRTYIPLPVFVANMETPVSKQRAMMLCRTGGIPGAMQPLGAGTPWIVPENAQIELKSPNKRPKTFRKKRIDMC